MMSAFSAAPEDVHIAGNVHDDLAWSDGVARGKTRGRTLRVMGLVLLSGLILVGGEVGLRGALVDQTPSLAMVGAPLPPFSVPVMPAAPTNGVLTMVVPSGAAADQRNCGRGYQMPDVIQLAVGDTIVLRNDDTAPHMILYAFLMPGETHERTLTAPGSEVYSAGCGVHAAALANFTTLFVSEEA